MATKIQDFVRKYGTHTTSALLRELHTTIESGAKDSLLELATDLQDALTEVARYEDRDPHGNRYVDNGD